MSPWARWSLKLLMLLLALSGFAAGADQDLGPGGERSLGIEPVSSGAAWQSLSQAMNPPLALAALLADASSRAGATGATGAAGTHALRAADEVTPPCESSAGLLLLACLAAPLLRRRRASQRA